MIIPVFFLILLMSSLLWPVLYKVKYFKIRPYLSHTLQLLIFFALLVFADSNTNISWIKFIISGVAFTFTLLLLFNALLMSITSINLFESLKIFSIGSDFMLSMEEAGFPRFSVVAAPAGGILLICIGGLIYSSFPNSFNIPITTAEFLILLIFLFMTYIFEQLVSKNFYEYFSRREYPLYLSLFSKGRYTLEFDIPSPPSEEQIKKTIDKVKPASNKKNIIYIVLESFRHDMVDKKICPVMNQIYSESLQIKESYGSAIYTSLSWNTIFLDRPSWTVDSDISSFNGDSSGSVLLQIFKKAGYNIYLSASANMHWNKFLSRINGRGLIDKSYLSYDEHKEKPRNIIDDYTVSNAITFMEEHKSKKPYLMFVHLDSSHWTYFFDKSAEKFKPFPDSINMVALKSRSYSDKVFNRYKNSATQIDNEIGKIVTYLKSSGKYDNTEIIIVSDHGEGFTSGIIGHSVLTDDIKRVPIIIKLPGIKNKKINGTVSHMDIMPTLFEYAGININKDFNPGKSLLSSLKEEKPVLILHGSMQMADLTFDNFSVSFKTEFSKDKAKLTPYRITEKNGAEIKQDISIENLKKSLTYIIEKKYII